MHEIRWKNIRIWEETYDRLVARKSKGYWNTSFNEVIRDLLYHVENCDKQR